MSVLILAKRMNNVPSPIHPLLHSSTPLNREAKPTDRGKSQFCAQFELPSVSSSIRPLLQFLLCLIFLMTPTDVFAQQNFQWRNFTRFIHGLSGNNVRFITEDPQGQIWLATSTGLGCFDGFWHEIDLAGDGLNFSRPPIGGEAGKNDISRVLITNEFIWIATNAGVYQGIVASNTRRNREIEWQRHYTAEEDGLPDNRITAMIERRFSAEHGNVGEVWVGTLRGVSRFDGEVWQPIPNAADGALERGVQVIYEDETEALWFGLSPNSSPNRLSRLDRGQWQVFGVNDGLPNGDVRTIATDSVGRLWVGTSEGIGIYDGSTWAVITTHASDFPVGDVPVPYRLIDNRVNAIMRDRFGMMWIGTTSGINLFDRGRSYQLTKVNGLVSNNITTVFESRDGPIWVGTRDGVSFSDRSWRSFTTTDGLSDNRVTAMLTDRTGAIWVGTQNGLVRHTHNGVMHVNGLPAPDIRALTEDLQGRIWVGTNSGIAVYDTVGVGLPNPYIPAAPVKVFRFEKGSNDIQSIVADSSGDIWAATGLVLPGESTVFPPFGLNRYDGVSWESGVLPEIKKTVVTMCADSRRRIYFGTVGDATFGSDLWVYNGGVLRQMEGLPNHAIEAIIEAVPYGWHDLESPASGDGRFQATQNGDIWVATQDGIQLFDGELLQPTARITTNDGLVDNRVKTLYRSLQGAIWIGTTDGVSMYQNASSHLTTRKGGQFVRTLTANDGLNSNNVSAITEAVDGTLWFGDAGGGGISRFNQEANPPATRIIAGPTNGARIGDTSVFYRFQGGDASTPTQALHYQYQLDNSEARFTDKNGFEDSVLLSGLAEGEHRFVVKAIDIEGNSDPVGAQAFFIVDALPPIVRITAPEREAIIGGVFPIEGYATDETDFLEYHVTVLPENGTPSQTLPTHISRKPIQDDTLFEWDTREVSDGKYTIQLVAQDTKNGDFDRSHQVQTNVTVEVDNTPPRAIIQNPVPDAEISGTTEVEIELTDPHLASYRLEYTRSASTVGDGLPVPPWQIINSRQIFSPQSSTITLQINWDTSTVDGAVQLRATVTDAAGNIGGTVNIPLILKNESAKPIVAIRQPSGTQPIGGAVSIIGTVDVGTAPNALIENFTLDFRPVDDPTGWITIQTGRFSIPNAVIARWETEGIADGVYLLRLTAIDNNDYKSTFEIQTTLDNTPPEAVISAPQNGAVLKNENIVVSGTATDTHFSHYELQFVGNGLPVPYTPSLQFDGLVTENEPIKLKIVRNEPIVKGQLGNQATLPGGEYTFQLTVFDQAGLNSSVTVDVTLDNADVIANITSPEPDQFVSGRVQIVGKALDVDGNFDRYTLSIRPLDLGSVGTIDIFDPNQPKDNAELGLWDTPQQDGSYEIVLSAFDRAGKQRDATVRVRLDNRPPEAQISQVVGDRLPVPPISPVLSGDLEIIGTADDTHFQEYRLDFRPVGNTNRYSVQGGVWKQIPVENATQPQRNTTLAIWETPQIEGEYEIRLSVTDASPSAPSEDIMPVVIDNEQPQVEITQPINGELVLSTLEIIGTANDAYLESYQLDFRPVGDGLPVPYSGWQAIGTFTEPKRNAVLTEWTAPKVEGFYEIRLTVKDRTGRPAVQARVKIIVDRLNPQAAIISPRENEQLPQQIEIRGTASDHNFKQYVIEYAPDEASDDDDWLKISKTAFLKPVNRDTLAVWPVPNRFGKYTLRLTVEDTGGHFSRHRVTVFFKDPLESRSGGVAESEDGRAKVTFPPNSLSDRTVVTINPNIDLPSITPSRLKYIGIGYDFAFDAGVKINFKKPATIEVTVPQIREETLAVFRQNGEEWKYIGGTVNPKRGTISAAVFQLGRYAVLEIPHNAGNEGDVKIVQLTCQPRIFSPNRDREAAISFQLNSPTAVTVKVYNAAGRLRRTLIDGRQLSSGTQVIWWDGRNHEGHIVASNFYIITVEAKGVKQRKTIVVQNN